MNKKYLKPIIILRVGLGAVFVYAGISSLAIPTLWSGFIPSWLLEFFDESILIIVHGIIQTAIGALLLLGYWLKEISLAAFFDILLIIIFFGIDPVTFRDFGLLMMALALFFMVNPKSSINH
ncbi:MAG: hypothetical protein WDZ80_03925 [Candidatus Paceibacterota bacterium]